MVDVQSCSRALYLCENQISGRGNYVKIKQLCQALRGSLSAVSKPMFARKYSLESSRRDLQIPHSTRDLKFQFFAKNPDSFGRLILFSRKNCQNLNYKFA